MSLQKLNLFKEENTREVRLPDGTTQSVQMTPDLWADAHFLLVVENITTTDIARFAVEEVGLQDGLDFNRAFRGVVAHLASRWT